MTKLPFVQRQQWVAMAAILLVVVAAIAATVGLMYRAFDDSIGPQVLKKADTAGRSLSGLISQAASHDIPLEKLVGVDALFKETIKKHPEISHIALLQAGQAVTATGQRGGATIELTARMPVAGYEAAKAELTVAIDPQYVRRLFEEMTLDLLVVAVVTLFISLELLYFLAGGLVMDVVALIARAAALSRGGFFPMPTAHALGQPWSQAMDAQARALAQKYQAALALLRTRLRERHVRGSAESKVARNMQLHTALAALREVKARFRFTESRKGQSGVASQGAALILGAMRAPFFLLLLGDDLSRSFMPLFAAGLAAGPLVILPTLVSSLPIFTFMLVVALSQPLLGGWSERIGRRRSFLAGAVLAGCAHFLSAQASSLPELLVWRAAGGAAWAMAFVATQGYILDQTDTRTRTAGLAAFVGIIMVSMVCGPSIGGILADGVGHRATVALAGALAVVAIALAWVRLPPDAARNASAVVPAAGLPKLGVAFTNRRFMGLLLLAAVPAKVILIAYCFYLVPLFVVSTGGTAAMAGRMIMLYSIMMVLLVPRMANWMESLRSRASKPAHNSKLGRAPEVVFVSFGLALSGLAGLAMLLPPGLVSPMWVVLLMVLLLGIGQSLSISPQAAMVADVCKEEIKTMGQSAVYGVYRMVERIGNAIGPLIAATLLELAGFQTAFVAIGVATLLCAALFWGVFRQPAALPLATQHKPTRLAGP